MVTVGSNYTDTIETTRQQYDLISETGKKSKGIHSLRKQIDEIVCLHPDVTRYSYIKEIHSFLFPREHDSSFINNLRTILHTDVHWDYNHHATGFVDAQTKHRDFTIYYCLALYCKRKEKASHAELSLDKLIGEYGLLFSEFILSLEIRSWYARRMEQFDDAYRCDRELINKIAIEENAGVYNSFASSVSSRLEKEYKSQKAGNSVFCWENPGDRYDDWKKACSYMPDIISNWKKVWNSESGYGKHYFIWGKLLMYSPVLKEMSHEKRRECIQEAKNKFSAAISCENPSDSDYSNRRSEYERYRDRCDKIEEEWAKYQGSHMPVATYVMSVRNNRNNLNKPNEDCYVINKDKGIYLLADGVTRPHDEYTSDKESKAAICAKRLCEVVCRDLLCSNEADPAKALVDAMVKGNRAIRDLHEGQQFQYPPCATFLGAVLNKDQLYFSSCCDTVAFLIRNNVKIRLTEHYNKFAELLGLSKEEVYSRLHNNIEDPAGFGIFNGAEALRDFLHVGHIQVKAGDRIVLATDGMSRYLCVTRASHLCSISLKQMLRESEKYDCLPFQKYADDKTCIVIDI